MTQCKIRYLISTFLIATPFIVNANIIWPSVYVVQQYYSWYVIIAGLFIETVAAHMYIKTSWKKSLGMMLVSNLISALVGWILILTSGIVVELLIHPFGGSTFGLASWILDYLCAILSNTCIEGLALKWIFKHPFKSNFLWLFGANAVSVVICIIMLALA